MSKKLDITAITNDLEGSAFFPAKKPTSISPTQRYVPELKPPEEPIPTAGVTLSPDAKPQTPERANASADQRPNGKRIITRNSFEIYEDQMDSLRKLSYQEKMQGQLGSMSGMVREAIDRYLHTRTAKK